MTQRDHLVTALGRAGRLRDWGNLDEDARATLDDLVHHIQEALDFTETPMTNSEIQGELTRIRSGLDKVERDLAEALKELEAPRESRT